MGEPETNQPTPEEIDAFMAAIQDPGPAVVDLTAMADAYERYRSNSDLVDWHPRQTQAWWEFTAAAELVADAEITRRKG